MTKDMIYELLAEKFVTYRDLTTIDVVDNGEDLISIADKFDGDIVVQEEYKAYVGDAIYVRESVLKRLNIVQDELKKINPEYILEVCCGYRPMEIQEANYNNHMKVVLAEEPELSGDELKEVIHRYSAVPSMAGHPTGGAVDVRINSSKGLLDMGTVLADPDKDTYVFSPYINKTAWHNRQILRACMIRAGFAPFDGEWWHFSYGDKEWAAYYQKEHALYKQLRFSV